MRKLLALSICAVALFGLMSCQNETTPIVDQLKYSDTPNWSGTTWQGSETDNSITRYVETVNGSSSSTVRTDIQLCETVYELLLRADGTFRLTISSAYGANWANDYIPDNWNYSTDPALYIPPALAITGTTTTYSSRFINGEFRSSYEPTSLPTTEYQIGTTPTTYNGQTVYPVTFSTTSAAALKAAALVGKAYDVNTIEGRYDIYAISSNPVNKGSIPYLTPTSDHSVYVTDFDNSGNVLTQSTETRSINDDEVYYFNTCFNFTNGLAVNPEGEQVYSILCRRYFYDERSMKKKDMPISSSIILYQQN